MEWKLARGLESLLVVCVGEALFLDENMQTNAREH